MKQNILYTLSLTASLCFFISSCTKNFENINVDSRIISDVDVRTLFTSALQPMMAVGSEFTSEGFAHFLSAGQLVTGQNYSVTTTGVNGRYNRLYVSVLPNLVEVRRLIALKPDAEKFEQINAITYIPQVMMALKVSDMNGSIPYTEANQGRFESNYSPKYDNQETLFSTWLKELSDAIAVLQKGSTNQISFGNNDIFFRGDIVKWIKLANSLKLRIAARFENQDPARTAQIFKEVMTDATGPLSSTDDQLEYSNPTYYPFLIDGYNINIFSPHFAVGSAVKFLKDSDDPRLGIYYERNGLVGSFKDTLIKYGKTLPSWIDLNDPDIMYQGGPADFQSNPSVSSYFTTPFDGGGSNRYPLISTINRNFFAPTYNGGSGVVIDILFSYAEVCLQIAEFIQKGYGNGIDTKGSVADWYYKGIRASAKTANKKAVAAKSTSYSNIDALVDAHLDNPKVKLDGSNDLEKIYIQALLDFYLNPNEAFTLIRRTGYPKFNSTLLAREPISEILPRRWWTIDPGEVNRANWKAAITEQGFTPNDFTEETLNAERIWFDKKSPDFGEGN